MNAELGAELLDGRRHLIADADDVADVEIGRDLHVDDLQGDLRRLDHLTALDVRIFDFLIAVGEFFVAGDGRSHHGAQRVVADLDLRRQASP